MNNLGEYRPTGVTSAEAGGHPADGLSTARATFISRRSSAAFSRSRCLGCIQFSSSFPSLSSSSLKLV